MKKNELIVHWWEDNYGRHTCHQNVPGLSFDESLLGELVKRVDGWYFTTGETTNGPFQDTQKARRELEIFLGARQLNTWD